MSEETLKHGYEFAKGDPNPESIHGTKESEPEATLEKHVIHFEPAEPAEESNKTGISSPAVTKQHKPISKRKRRRLESLRL